MAIQYNGSNAQDVCEHVIGEKLAPYALAGGFWLKQDAAKNFQLTMPAKHGEVYLSPGDWAVWEDGGWIRLSDKQYQSEQSD
jgi:hypothetical protein